MDKPTELTDASELSSEDFNNVLADSAGQELEVPAELTGQEDLEPADTEPADTEPADTEPADTEPADTEPTGQEDADAESPGQEELFEINYKGSVQKLTKDKMIELAQKGFSYHSDMNRIAKHKKLVTLIENDEEIGGLVNEHIKTRATPAISELTDFESENDWLADNLSKQQKAERYRRQPETQDLTTEQSQGAQIVDYFKEKDEVNYEKVLQAMSEKAQQLTVSEYAKINGDMDELEQFYDKVKAELLAPVKPLKKTFRTKSGGGEPPRTKKTEPKIWEMSSKDFNKLVNQAKGY